MFFCLCQGDALGGYCRPLLGGQAVLDGGVQPDGYGGQPRSRAVVGVGEQGVDERLARVRMLRGVLAPVAGVGEVVSGAAPLAEVQDADVPQVGEIIRGRACIQEGCGVCH